MPLGVATLVGRVQNNRTSKQKQRHCHLGVQKYADLT